jgi:hypothetical protein
MAHKAKTKHMIKPIDAEAIRIKEIAWAIADNVVENFNNALLEDLTEEFTIESYTMHVEKAWADCYKRKLDSINDGNGDPALFIADAKLIRKRVCKRAVEILCSASQQP